MRKLLFLSIGILTTIIAQSQSLRNDTDSIVINHVFSDRINHIDIYAFPRTLTSFDTIFLMNGDTIMIPYENCSGYFVDFKPFSNWMHPCKYCFVNALNNYTIIDAENPPVCDSLTPLSLCPRANPMVSTTYEFDTVFERALQHCSCDPEHLWAVLICGDDEVTATRPDQYPQYWFDLSCVYTVLANVFGYQENIDDTYQNRRIIVMAPTTVRTQYTVPDLNGNDTYHNNFVFFEDGNGGDFFNSYNGNGLTSHTKENIENIFRCLAGRCQYQHEYESLGLRKLTKEDQLFVFITGHGYHGNNGKSFFFVNEGDNYNKPKIYDDDLVGWLKNIECSQMTLFMENCFSGGFIEKFLQDIFYDDCLCKNRIGFSAASANGPSHAECYKVYSSTPNNTYCHDVSEFVYYWAAAALGYYPFLKGNSVDKIVEIGPWNHPEQNRDIGSMDWSPYFNDYYETNNPHSNYDQNPDTDQDGLLSFYEMFEFANNLDTWSPQGYYHPYGADSLDNIENPLQLYESTFTKEAATPAGYEGQIDGDVNSGTAEQPYRLCGDIWISADSKLTMWDEVQSPENVKVYIKPSGKLVLDGATLTNLPEEQRPMWIGVQVWGNSNKHQLKENGRYWQGVLEMKNEARIQNAITAIDVWNPEDDKSMGGIVNAENAYFNNNTTTVFFHPYENQFEHPHHPGNLVVKDNVSYFKNCEFSIDDKYIGPNQFEMHANLFRVRGVGFYGCNFKYYYNVYSKPCTIGIFAYDAGFKLEGVCTSSIYSYPCQIFDNSTFDGFCKAVVSVNDGAVGVRPMTVKNTNFINNSFGVFNVRSGYPLILNSTFSIGQDSTKCAVGIFADQTPNFTIEQDTFGIAGIHPYENYGIVIKNSKSQNLIYKNVFNGLYCANLSVGRNNTWMMPRNTTDVKSDILGLEYRCNENSDNLCDFYVLGGNNYNKLGIQNNQGSVMSPANNTFSQGGRYHFMNHGNYGINYHYNSNLMNSMPNTGSIGVTIELTEGPIDCPSHYGYYGICYNDTLTPVLSNTQRQQREMDYYTAYNSYNALKAIYENRLNGGDTETEIAEIQSAVPSDMLALRTQLLSHSPYLTEEVLTTVANKNDVFPQSVLFEILASNIDELKNDSLIEYLQNMNNPLPNYMISLLHQLANGVTDRTAMESQLARYSQEYRQAAGDIIRSILNDTIIDKTALVGWLGNMNDIESDREIVSIYLEDCNYTDALALANLLPTFYGLTGDDLVEYNDYLVLLNLYCVLNADERNTLQLDSTERAIVEHIADYSTGTPQAMAKAIMIGAYGYIYDDCPSGLDLYYPVRKLDNMFSSFSNEDISRAMGLDVNMSPNPASTWVTIEYSLPSDANKAQMRIINTLGMTVATYDLQGKESQKILDLRDLTSGVYTYVVSCGRFSNKGKLVIVK